MIAIRRADDDELADACCPDRRARLVRYVASAPFPAGILDDGCAGIKPRDRVAHAVAIGERRRMRRPRFQVGARPDEDDALARLRDAEPLRVKEPCLDPITKVLHRPIDQLEVSLRDALDEPADVLRDEHLWSQAVDQPDELEEQIIRSLF